MTSHIILEGLTVHCIVGLLPKERTQTQDLVINIAIELDFQESARQDALVSDSIDYAKIAIELENLIQISQFKTLESAAWNCTHFIFSNYSQPKTIDIELIKPTAIPNCPKAGIKISIDRNEWANAKFTQNDNSKS